MMDHMIGRFPAQLSEALVIGKNTTLRKPERIANVFVTGLGGSGIGGNFVAEFVRHSCSVPYVVSKGYDIPAWVGKDTLAIVSSYSGNTEETLAALTLLETSGATIIVISSGGRLLAKARAVQWDHFSLPDDWPSPRACLGYSLVQQLVILTRFGLVPSSVLQEIESSSVLLEKEKPDIKERAEKIAALLFGKTAVIYTTDRMEAVAVRLRQQLNENSKTLCWHHVIPEMNHNELVGWRDRRDDLAVLFLRNRDDAPRNQMRIEINKEIIAHYTSTIIEVYAKGQTTIEQALYHVHLGDWVSWYLAQLRGMDALEVRVIDFLKEELGKVS